MCIELYVYIEQKKPKIRKENGGDSTDEYNPEGRPSDKKVRQNTTSAQHVIIYSNSSFQHFPTKINNFVPLLKHLIMKTY